jgi:hypothetical protein
MLLIKKLKAAFKIMIIWHMMLWRLIDGTNNMEEHPVTFFVRVLE